LPRDSGGTYSRIIPPGAPGYQANTDILSAQVNSEINDIGNELTKSIAKDGTTTPTANLPMANFVHSGMGQADAAGESLRYEALGKGSDIAVTANGTVTLPLEGSLFNLTAASSFNVTGFTGRHDGRPFCVRFNPDKLLTLVNSATFKLLGGVDRITRAGEIIHFTQESAGTIAEVGQQPIIDMTGYSGADIKLGIGQSAIYDIAAVTTLLLRIAVATNQFYNLVILPNFPAGAAGGAGVQLLPNNSVGVPNNIIYMPNYNNNGTWFSPAGVGQNLFTLHTDFTFTRIDADISTRTENKSVFTRFTAFNGTQYRAGFVHNISNDIATAWGISLGTLTFPTATTGRVMLRRVM